MYRMLVDILFYLFELNHRLVDTEEVLGLGLASQVLGFGIGLDLDGQVLGLAFNALAFRE